MHFKWETVVTLATIDDEPQKVGAREITRIPAVKNIVGCGKKEDKTVKIASFCTNSATKSKC